MNVNSTLKGGLAAVSKLAAQARAGNGVAGSQANEKETVPADYTYISNPGPARYTRHEHTVDIEEPLPIAVRTPKPASDARAPLQNCPTTLPMDLLPPGLSLDFTGLKGREPDYNAYYDQGTNQLFFISGSSGMSPDIMAWEQRMNRQS